MLCARCKKDVSVHIMSFFNKDEICLECSSLEKKHPDYRNAVEADRDAIKKGNFNFEGIGKPSNL